MTVFSRRLTCVAMVCALMVSPAVLSACMVLCLDSHVPSDSHARHRGHGATAGAAVAHQHHDMSASTQTAARMASDAPQPASDTRLSAICDSCCGIRATIAGAGRVVEFTSAKAAAAPAVAMASLNTRVATPTTAALSPPLPPPVPIRAPLALRI